MMVGEFTKNSVATNRFIRMEIEAHWIHVGEALDLLSPKCSMGQVGRSFLRYLNYHKDMSTIYSPFHYTKLIGSIDYGFIVYGKSSI